MKKKWQVGFRLHGVELTSQPIIADSGQTAKAIVAEQ